MTNRRIRRLLFAGGAVAALLGAAIVVICYWPVALPPPLPNPNGYDELLRAAQAVKGKIGDAAELDHNALRALVATNAEVLRLVREGLSLPCAVPTEAQIANFATISRDLIGLRSLATILSAEGRLAEMEDRPADSARSYVDAIRLGSEMSRGGLMINRLVGIACEGRGSIDLVELLPKINCEQVRPIITGLEKLDASTVSWREVLQNENRFARAQLGNYPNPVKLVSDWWKARDTRKVAGQRHDLAAAHVRLLMVELALRLYRCDHGNSPGNLTQLVPKYLERLPKDPFNDKPLIYRPSGTNWVLYSLGPDRKDNGGKPMGKITEDYLLGVGASKSGEKKNEGDLFYNSDW